MDGSVWRGLYASWLSGYTLGANPGTPLSTVNASIAAAAGASTAIHVPLFFASYATLRPDAVAANLLSVSGDQLYDVAGRSQSPYMQQRVFAAFPAKIFSPSNRVSFVLKSDLLFGNGGSVGSLQIDFGDGRGYLPAN